jgi:hypothetical protein
MKLGIVVIIILSALDVFFVMRLKSTSAQIEHLNFVLAAKEDQIKEITAKASYLNDNLIIGYNKFSISDSVISNLHLSKPLLILRIHSEDCNTCIAQSLKVLEIKANQLKYNVAVFADFPSENAVKHEFSVRYPIFIIGKNKIDIDKKAGASAYYFVLEKNNHLRDIFMPQSGRMNLFEEYLNTL